MAGKWDDLKKSVTEKIAKTLKENLKVEEREFVNPWASEDKAAVLQKTRCFSDTPIDAPKCLELCTRVLYLLQQGETFTPKELTSLFFDVTKLFQAPSTRLRRMTYLIIKELEPAEGEVFIAIASLIKDINGRNASFRGNSIRVVSRILDASMAAQVDRILKIAIVDQNPFVASSSLVCGITLSRTAPDVVRRWLSEVQECLSSKHQMVQFHALALMYELKKNDRLALHKVVMGLAKSSNKSPMTECLLIRYSAQTLMTERDPSIEKALIAYLDSCLRQKSEMVQYEAARAFCQLAAADTEGTGTTVFGYDITNATTVLQIFLTSPKPVARFGAIRTLNLLAQTRPQVAARCNCDMEPLLTDQNRNTATLALTTLLKTGHESNVERLVKQITSFMSDISDAFKVEVVRAVKGLCVQYPSKYKVLMTFLSSNLREDGTVDFKRDLVEALVLVVGQVPAAREAGLLHLCEYIEDCEFPSLCSRVLCFLGDEVPSTPQPSKYIRFIYNRLILENALVRAAAVEALAKIAMKCPSLRTDVLLLLEFGENDNDDEVRERIGLYTSVLRQCIKADGGAEGEVKAAEGFSALVSHELPFSLDALYDGLLEFVSSDMRDTPFSFEALPTDEAYRASVKAQGAATEKKKPGVPAAGGKPTEVATAAAKAEAEQQKAASNAELVRVVGEILPIDQLGPMQHSCRPVYVTETESEYTVQVVKHMFKDHVVLEMYVTNTVPKLVMENVEVRLTGFEPNWVEVGASAISRLEHNQNGSAYMVLAKAAASEETAGVVTGSFGATLHFLLKEDGDDLGYDDDYPMENVTISAGDYMFPRMLPSGQFKAAFEQLGVQGNEAEQRLNFASLKTLDAAVNHIMQTLNMEACDKSNKPDPEKNGIALLLSGSFQGGTMVLVKALIGINQNCAVARLSVRSKNAAVCNVIANALS